VPIPANPALLRQTALAHGAAFAPGSNPLALAVTAGLAIRIQSTGPLAAMSPAHPIH
jgi:hypothetical protein